MLFRQQRLHFKPVSFLGRGRWSQRERHLQQRRVHWETQGMGTRMAQRRPVPIRFCFDHDITVGDLSIATRSELAKSTLRRGRCGPPSALPHAFSNAGVKGTPAEAAREVDWPPQASPPISSRCSTATAADFKHSSCPNTGLGSSTIVMSCKACGVVLQ